MLRAQSPLFSPIQIGPLSLKNRFMRSSTAELHCTSTGLPKPELKNLLVDFAKNEVGLIIPGVMYINQYARVLQLQAGMATEAQSEAWKPITAAIHENGSQVIFQLSHAGPSANVNASLGKAPYAPSILRPLEVEMTVPDIEKCIQDFVTAAKLSYHAGADGVQLQLAHGYLLSSFLSPYFNQRTDVYKDGIRLVKEIVEAIKQVTPKDFAITAKINCNDYREGGITPSMAAENVYKLKDHFCLFEISCGTGSPQHTSPSIVNDRALNTGLSNAEKMMTKAKTIAGCEGVDFIEGYNLSGTKVIRQKNPGVQLAAVGTLRDFGMMEDVVKSGLADMVSLSRPLLRDPTLVKKFLDGTADRSSCISCGVCKFALPKTPFCHVPAD